MTRRGFIFSIPALACLPVGGRAVELPVTYDMDRIIPLSDREIIGVETIWAEGKIIWQSSWPRTIEPLPKRTY